MLLRVLPYSVRWLSKYLNETWTCRLLHHLSPALTNFQTTILHKGIRLGVHTGENTGRKTFYLRKYEDAQEQVFLAMISDRRVFDIGANIGLFALLAASRGAQVFAFEPSRRARKQLEMNTRLNDFGRLVTIIPKAVSASDGTINFFEAREDNLGVGRIFAYGHSAGKSHDYIVPTNTLDYFISQLGMPNLVKIDVEGAEWLVLKGASRTLACRDAPDFLIEFHPDEIAALGGTMDECTAHLLQNGFTQYWFIDPMLRASRHIWSVFSKKQLALPGLKTDKCYWEHHS